jgi:hypothetical protein
MVGVQMSDKGIEPAKLLAQRSDPFYNLLLGRSIGEVRHVPACVEGVLSAVSTCPVCCGRLKHNNYLAGETPSVVVRCRLCDAEFVIKVQFRGDLL